MYDNTLFELCTLNQINIRLCEEEEELVKWIADCAEVRLVMPKVCVNQKYKLWLELVSNKLT